MSESTKEILLLTHGGWGMSLVKGIEMLLGKVEFVHEIPLEPAYTLPEYMQLVKEHAETMASGSLILTDLIGGTTSNVAAVVGNQTGIKVFCGLNAPMLLEACVELQNDGALDFDAVLAAGQGACMDVVAAVRSTMAQKA